MSCAIPLLQFPEWTGEVKRGRGASKGPRGPNIRQFEAHSQRRELAPGRADRTITALTYLEPGRPGAPPQVIAVATYAQLMRALRETD
jgi:hypothetical protein